MSSSAVDNEVVSTGWYALPTSTNQAFLLIDHQTLGVDDRGALTETGREAAHACQVRQDRGVLRIETIRGEVSVNGRRVGKRALISDSGVLRLGQQAFFLSEQALAAEPVEVVNELPGIWQPFMEEMQIEEIEPIPEPGQASTATQDIVVAEPATARSTDRGNATVRPRTEPAPRRRVPVVALFALAATLVFTALLLWQTRPPTSAQQAPAGVTHLIAIANIETLRIS